MEFSIFTALSFHSKCAVVRKGMGIIVKETKSMIRKIKLKTKINLIMILCIITFLALQFTIMFGSFEITSYKGVISAFQFVMCLIMIRQDYRKGAVISITLMIITGISAAANIMIRRDMTPLPGICNTVIYIVTIYMLSRQFAARDKEAVTDFLTGLKSRRGLYKLLRWKIEDNKPFHLIYIDLGNFKIINDNFGHAAGDKILKEVAEKMTDVLGESKNVSRIGGDEFVAVVEGGKDPKSIATEMIDRISTKYNIIDNGSPVDCYLTAYAGISSFPQDSTDADSLIKYADIAMFQAARNKTQKVCFFDKAMEQQLQRQMELENLVKDSLEKDFFYLDYQPQYMLDGKKLRGFEALLRLKTADGKLVSPGEFIPVAEKGDLIFRIDDYVLHRAMTDFCNVIKENGEDITISVNVSAKNISAANFADKVRKELEKTGFPAKCLEIEITEYSMAQSVDTTIENIIQLRKMGVQVALDDFGTGYTSLSYLSKMPINLLKVDKSLVDDIETNEKNRKFVNTVISMGHIMGCEVISEGVESESQLSILKQQNCDYVQGYVWSKPLAYQNAIALATE